MVAGERAKLGSWFIFQRQKTRNISVFSTKEAFKYLV